MQMSEICPSSGLTCSGRRTLNSISESMLGAQVTIATRWSDLEPSLRAEREQNEIEKSQLEAIGRVNEAIQASEIYSQDHPECEKLGMCMALAGYAIKATDALLPKITLHIEIMEEGGY